MLLTSDFVVARYEALRERAPWLEIVTEVPEGQHEDIEAVFTFKLPEGIAPRLPNLRLVASVGAGADGILNARDLPKHVRVTRATEPGLGLSMAQFVALQVLRQFRSLPSIERNQAEGKWQRVAIPDARELTIGVMGLGAIGATVAQTMCGFGFNVIGWTRSNSRDTGIPMFVGPAGLKSFLERSDYLICLLPYTAETNGLLDAQKLALLPKGSYLVNVARGGIVVEDDLRRLIDEGHLSGAALDVFATEPLPSDSPIWRHPKILVSPHVAAQPAVEPVVEQFIDNLSRLAAGQPLINEINRELGY